MLKELQTLKSTATGLDSIGTKILKISAPVISPTLSKILNLSIRTGKFPSQWKKAKVVSLQKSGDQSNRSNYRPISLLPILSKVLERHVANSLISYLHSFNLISDTQSGFRKCHNCETSLLKLTQDFYDCLNRKEAVGFVSLDFRKAFDLVNHSILLKKLQLYKFYSKSLAWFHSYLHDRSQRVSFKNSLSSSRTIPCRVPQGSILGPLLFITFINDLVFSILESNMTLYADDCSLYTSSSSLETVNANLNRDVKHIKSWSKDNKMVINLDKSYSMPICTCQKLKHLSINRLNIC